MTKRINSRTKGASGEREFSALIHDITGVKLVRNLEQSRSGGHDLIVENGQPSYMAVQLDKYAIECKRYATVSQASLCTFWAQTVKQAQDVKKIPLLAYRANRSAWRIVLPLEVLMGNDNYSVDSEQIAIITLAGFVEFFTP